MVSSWIALHPQWYAAERELLARHYPGFRVDEVLLESGILCLYGELKVRPPGGTVRHPVALTYHASTPYEHPIVRPLEGMPEFGEDGGALAIPETRFFDRRHQMAGGAFCLFQRETRGAPGGDVVRGIDALHRAERWLLGYHTGHWPPDSADTELETHFEYATDALLGQAFFQVRPETHGEFYLVPDLRRISEGRVEGYCPYVATALTEEGGIIRVREAGEDLARVYPWIAADAWDPYRLAAPGTLERLRSERTGIERGYWWFLPSEPQPFHDGGGLLRELAPLADDGNAWPLVSGALKGAASTSRRHFMGLCYPGRHSGVEWLMLIVDSREEPSGIIQTEAEKRRIFEQSKVYDVRVQSVRPSDLQLRNCGVVDPGIGGKTVALLGLGALGSKVAEMLGQAGVGRFLLADIDRLSTGNVTRHVGGIHEFGATKARVVMSRLLEINPALEFDEDSALLGSLTASRERLSQFMATADLVVSTVADESVESVINEVAVQGGKPVLYARALRKGSLGRVFLVRPGADACKACLAEYARSSRAGGPAPADWIDVPEAPDDAVLHECGRPVIPASAVDLSFVATLAARAALDFLEGGADAHNHWIWSRPESSGIDARLSAPLSTFAGTVPRSPRCPVCNEPEVTEIVIPDSVLNEMHAMTEASLDRETGGVLIGFVDGERRAVVVRATGPGPNAVRTATRFERDIEFTQQELDRAAAELGDRGVYLGEWHSHLVAVPRPSPTDITSLYGIAVAPNYLTRCPAMIIAGLDTRSGKVDTTRAWVFPQNGRVYEVPYLAVNDVSGFQQAGVHIALD